MLPAVALLLITVCGVPPHCTKSVSPHRKNCEVDIHVVQKRRHWFRAVKCFTSLPYLIMAELRVEGYIREIRKRKHILGQCSLTLFSFSQSLFFLKEAIALGSTTSRKRRRRGNCGGKNSGVERTGSCCLPDWPHGKVFV